MRLDYPIQQQDITCSGFLHDYIFGYLKRNSKLPEESIHEYVWKIAEGIQSFSPATFGLFPIDKIYPLLNDIPFIILLEHFVHEVSNTYGITRDQCQQSYETRHINRPITLLETITQMIERMREIQTVPPQKEADEIGVGAFVLMTTYGEGAPEVYEQLINQCGLVHEVEETLPFLKRLRREFTTHILTSNAAAFQIAFTPHEQAMEKRYSVPSTPVFA